MSIRFTGSDGRSYPDAGSMMTAEVKRLIATKYDDAERAIRREVCPVHHQSPSLRRSQSGDKTNFHIEACCEELTKRARTAFERAMAA